MTTPIATAWTRVRANGGVWLLLGTVQLLLLEMASRPLSAALAPLLDYRPAAERLVAGDDGLFIDLASRQPLLGTIAGGVVPLVVLLAALWGWVQCGAVFVALERDGGMRPPVSEVLQLLAKHAARMLAIGLAGLGLRLVVGGAVLLLWLWLRPDRADLFSELCVKLAIVAAVGGFLWSLATVILDYARSLAVRGERVGRALRGALAMTRRKPGATLRLALLSSLLFVTITAVAQLALAASESLTLAHLLILWLAAALRVATGALGLLAAALTAADA